MKAPLLNRLLTMEAPAREDDGAGGAALRWSPVGAHWAELRPSGGREEVVGGVVTSAVTHRATVRWSAFGAPSRPTALHRLRDGARVYDVIAVTEAEPRNLYLHVWLREGASL